MNESISTESGSPKYGNRFLPPTAAAAKSRWRPVVTAVTLTLTAAVAAKSPDTAQVNPNFRGADISEVIEAVSLASGKNFIVDPRVRAQVTMLASTPLTPDAFYEAFLAILQVHGFVAVAAGDVIKIIPDANARQLPANDLPRNVSATSDEIVTQVIAVRNVSAAQLVPILRPLIPQYGHLAAYPTSNILIIADHAANVNRIERIVRRIDQVGDAGVEVVALTSATAADVVRIVTSLNQGPTTAEGGGGGPRLVADERTNSVLVGGEQASRLRAKALIAHLDTPLENGGDTQVRYLHYADAEKISAKLKEQTSAATTGAAGGAQGATGHGGDRSTTIWADPETNALVITAPPKVMRSIMTVIDKLDIRRAQVLVEATLVEVSADKSAEIGVNWAIWAEIDGQVHPAGGFVSDVGGASIVDLYELANSGGTSGSMPSGTTLGIGRIASSGLSFAAMLRALRGDAQTNVIATPSTVTLDNQEATIKIAQQVPFVTGQYSNTGSTDGVSNPFQTIQREDVGTIFKVTPQINEGDTVLLKLSIENSSLSESSQAVDLITNKRTVDTSVLIEDGGIVVIGGLIQDSAGESEQRVPLLGSIPLLGFLFKTHSTSHTKTNLMVFIRPRILRDGKDAAIETNVKHQSIREQMRAGHPKARLPGLGGEQYPTLPPIEEPSPQGAAAERPPAVHPPATSSGANQTTTATDATDPP